MTPTLALCWELSLFERLFAAIRVRGVSSMCFWKKTRRRHVLRLELCYEYYYYEVSFVFYWNTVNLLAAYDEQQRKHDLTF